MPINLTPVGSVLEKKTVDTKPAPKSSPKKEEVVAPRAEAKLDLPKVREVAQKLTRISDNSLRFRIKDPIAGGIDNVIVEIVNDKGDVISTIPSEEVQKMAAMSEEMLSEKAKGLLLDQKGV